MKEPALPSNRPVIKVRVNKLAANVVGTLMIVILCIAFIRFARLLPHYSSALKTWQVPATIGSLVILIVVHEALHGIGMIRFGKVSRRDIRFGFMWHALMPYCHCKVPLTVRACRQMGLLPLWITGGVTLTALLIFPADWLGLVTAVTWAACVGDVWLVLRLRRFAEDWLVQDSPTEIGCDVFPPST